MTDYVAGFLFNKDRDHVVLIRKQQPEWQKGRLNGIGGKVEPSDIHSEKAMSREFQEETGVWIEPTDWNMFCQYVWEDGIVCFYYHIDSTNEKYNAAKTIEAEEIVKVPVAFVIHQHKSIIYNLKWLIPLALDPSLQNSFAGPLGTWITVNE
jgi:8-oxo-dGTP diphosphatase